MHGIYAGIHSGAQGASQLAAIWKATHRFADFGGEVSADNTRLVLEDAEYFVRLVQTENIHRGRHMAHSLKLQEMTQPIIEQITHLLARGVAVGVFRRGIDPIELHMTLSALCFFHQGNRHTFGRQFDYDMSSPAAKVKRKKQIFELMWRYVRAED